jgi:hypothetical protein
LAKNEDKIGGFSLQITVIYSEKNITLLVLKKNGNFSPKIGENRRKWLS